MGPKATALSTGCTICVAASLALWPVATTTEPAGNRSDLLITNGTIIDGTGAAPIRDGGVVVRGSRIFAVGPVADLAIPRNVHIIDARGGTIMPGIINSHVHHAASADQRRRFLEEGVTTVCDLGSPLEELPLFDELDTAGSPVARGFFAGPILTAAGGYPDGLYGTTGFNYEVATPEEARGAVRDLVQRGASYIKVAMDPSWNTQDPLPMLDVERSRAIVQAAHELGLPVRMHVIQITHFPSVLDAGVDVVDHMPFPTGWPAEAEIEVFMASSDPLAPFFDERFPQYDTLLVHMAEAGMIMVPTVSALLRDYLVKPELTQREQFVRNVILDIVRRFHEAGGIVAVGNDFNDRNIEERLPLTEMKALRTAGFTPMEVIEAGTRLAALACDQENDLGTLEVGKLADIIVVGGDPIVDLDALRQITTVVVSGQVSRGGLPRPTAPRTPPTPR